MNAKWQRLRAEIAADRSAMALRMKELEAMGPLTRQSGAPACALVAVSLHHAYGAFEAACERIARELDGGVPGGADWHQRLLDTMALEIPGVRPAVVSSPALSTLRRLLAFRHFFRHAYAVTWDEVQLESLRQTVVLGHVAVFEDLVRFDASVVAELN